MNKIARLSLLPAYIDHPEVEDVHFYKTFDVNGHPTFVTLKPILPWVLFFRHCLNGLVRELSSHPFLWQMRSLVRFSLQQKETWKEPLILLDIMYLCLRIWNPVFRQHGDPHFLCGAQFHIYSEDLMARWKWFHQSLHDNHFNPVISKFFGKSFKNMKLMWQKDGQSRIDLQSDSFFVQHWLRIMVGNGWMSQYYLTQQWMRMMQSEKYQVHWLLQWFVVMASSWTSDLARTLKITAKNSASPPPPPNVKFNFSNFRMPWSIASQFALQKK